MYNVSDAYLEAISQPVRTFKIRAEFSYQNAPQKVFNDDRIKGDPMIESQVVSGSPSCGMIDLGAAISATASLTVIDDDATLKKYSGASFAICVSLLLENGEYEDVPMGTFYCDTSKMSRVGNQITVFGYDAMSTLNYVLTEDQKNRLKDTYAFLATKILVEKGKCNFNQTVGNFPNYGNYFDFSSTQIVTARDGIMWVAQLMGCCARINRNNYLEYVPIKLTWDNAMENIVPVRNISHLERYNTTFSDDRIHIVGVSMPDDNNNLIIRSSEGVEGDSNVTIALEKNPIIRPIDDIEYILDNILSKINTTYFYAFNAEIISDPALEAGDTVRLTGGLINGTNENNDIVGFITHNIWRYRGRHEIINTGQTPTTTSDDIIIEAPRSQSEKTMAALDGKTNNLNEKVGNITAKINSGVDRAKYLQTFNGSYYDTATAMRTTHSQRYSNMGGSIGYEFAEQTNNDYSTWNAMISGKMSYQKVTGEAYTRHPIADIYYNWGIKPAEAIDGTTPDGINLAVRGHSYKTGFSASAELSCDGLWVSDGLPGAVPYDKVQLFYAEYSHSSTAYNQTFVIAGVRFNIKEDGLYIVRPGTSLYGDTKSIFIPWRGSESTSAAAQSAQPEAQEAQTTSIKSAASGGEPSYTYDDDGIHISYNGHTKVIPWDT